ncbi:non-ribosomal peptide synthetase [Actinophytocola algeriensis]|uniref:Amino acid adenylation domain-containing protein n=1 Tax=Actinophytocola algeriensis TaxID=1768010 RepID=A0A7W7Q370_9PSEU|nr:non-ribosomal peptide synthetase [Actinophytocola algeriensis]MBB4906171.1 amino acid adenylation domain-containing protein [Actinophytocola algeriensis]MBE1472144.1 amino acid adenylation domain-containing protein [Actinophytocola algeriensis]
MPRDIPTAFAAHVADRPHATAVVGDGTHRTYAELDREAGAFATALRRHGAGPEDVVAVVADRGPRYVAMVLGVLRTGAAFVPVAPDTPVDRARRMCGAARVRVVLAEPEHEARAKEFAPAPVVTAAGAAVAAPVERHPEGLAYVIFTSGSTGVPKGAMVVDAGMANHTAAKVADLALRRDDVVGFTAPLSFDISVWQALTGLTVGAAVAVAAPENLAEPAELAAWVRRHGVTVLEIVPSFLAVVVEQLAADPGMRAALRSLRFLVATGEALPAPLVRRWYDCCPDVGVVNAYGPTECSDDVTHHLVSAQECAGRDWPPIGREVLNTRLYVVDEHGGECQDGTAGELYVGGRGVGRGYVADPVATALAFVPDHLTGAAGARLYRTGDLGTRGADGALDYHGRRDRQVKVRGHRVELGDVEAGLLRVPDVTAAACVLSAGRLHAFVTVRGGTEADRVLAHVRASAPGYLVPHRVTVVDEIPTNVAGKADHRALLGVPEPDAVRALVAEVLDVPSVAADENFFAAGGDSLVAMTLVAAARTRFAADTLSLRAFLADPTPRGLAAALTAARAAPDAAAAPPVPGALSSGQERLWFLEQLQPGKGAQLIHVELALTGLLDRDALRHALDAVVARHEPLRTVFTQEGGVPAGAVWPEATVRLSEDGVPDHGLSAATPRPPLMTAHLRRVADDHHVLTLVLHHLVADGWSLAILGREIAEHYQRWLDGDTAVSPPAATFGQYIAEERRWLAGAEAVEHERYWTGRLAGAPPAIDLPVDRPRPVVGDFTARHVVTELSARETSTVVATARAADATPFMAVVAAFHAVLRDLTGTDDVVVGIDSVNRSWPGSEELVGTFVNQLPVRLAGGGRTFGELLDLARTRCLGAYEHDRLPFHKIVAAVAPPRRAGRFPLFQVKVTHQSAWRTGTSLPDIEVVPSDHGEPVTDLDLMLDVSGEHDRLRLELLYRPEILDESTAARWLAAVAHVLRTGAAAPGAGVAAPGAVRTPTEQVVADVWCELLGRDSVDVEDNFFEIGGHSLLAVQVTHEISVRTGFPLELEALFELGTVAEIAAAVDRGRADVGAPAVLAGYEGEL